MPYIDIMSDEDSRNKVGNAGSICCSGRHKGSIATRVLSNHWRTDKYNKNSNYVSRWRRKNVKGKIDWIMKQVKILCYSNDERT